MENKKYFNKWTIKRKIGQGNFGSVYEITYDDFDETYRNAMKVVSIPNNKEEVEYFIQEGKDVETIRSYYEGRVKNLISEFKLMDKVKGHSNIVGYQDHEVIPHDDGIGYDVYIRMELLTPLTEYVKASPSWNESEIIKLGIDLCTALEVCENYKIIHRDIKPQNIFVSDSGNFKLGDFGVARQVFNQTDTLTRVGTFSYMAPEIYYGQYYDSRADIYSLGLLLYYYLNNYNMPFVTNDCFQFEEREKANNRRLMGKNLPFPLNGSDQLKQIVIKACCYDPNYRFQSATEFKSALMQIKTTNNAEINSFYTTTPEYYNQQQPTGTAYCIKCGSIISADASFCTACGQDQSAQVINNRFDTNFDTYNTVTFKDFVNNYLQISLKNDIKKVSIVCYIFAAINAVLAIAFNPISLIDVALLAGASFGLQKTKKKIFAILVLLLGLFEFILGLVMSGQPSGAMWIITGVWGIVTCNKIEKQYKQFKSSGI